MDKKNFAIGGLLLVAAFAIIFFGPKNTRPAPAPSPETATASSSAVPGTGASGSSAAAGSTHAQPPASAVNAAFAAVNHESADATETKLTNGFVEVRFTDAGGALRDVALVRRDEKGRLIYPEKLHGDTPFVFNALHSDPILGFVDFPGLDRNTRFERVSQTATEIVYRAVLDGRLEVIRRYTLAPEKSETADPYQVGYETTFRNLSDQTAQPMRVGFSLGTAAPINANDPGIQLATGYNNGSDRNFHPRADLEPGSGFLGFGAHDARPFLTNPGPIVWAAVKNQFFASILTGNEAGTGLVTRRVKLLNELSNDDHRAYGVTGIAQFEVKALAPKADTKLSGTIYVGPKEYDRLANSKIFKNDEDKVMNFGFFKFFSQILLWLMTKIHGFTNNWGIAIILTTLTLKTIFIPFTLAASRSAKRMAKIQPELQTIRDKYKDNPQKQQQATMELFKTKRINPVGGCFPILITIPFFMGFFSMLGSAAELRFQPFLWAPDLASQDTVAMIFGVFPLNIMPILMGATMIIQMHLTPSPSVDNMQMKMMKFMPYIFAAICYTFSCALSLYSFVNGLFTIFQQLIINRMKDPEETAPAVATGPAGKVIKNVTPPKGGKR